MTFFEIFLLCALPCALFVKLAFELESEWKRESRRATERVTGGDRPDRMWMQPDHRPADLYKPLAPVDVVRLPWKDGRW